jgi:hypothetical protein
MNVAAPLPPLGSLCTWSSVTSPSIDNQITASASTRSKPGVTAYTSPTAASAAALMASTYALTRFIALQLRGTPVPVHVQIMVSPNNKLASAANRCFI